MQDIYNDMKATKTTNFKQIFEVEKYKLSDVNDF